MLTTQRRQITLAVLLLSISLLSLQPGFTNADKNQNTGTITIDASGQATPLGKGKGSGFPGAAILTLTGLVHTEGKDELKLGGLTGGLQIGSSNYPITEGKGETNNHGTVEINAKASDGNRKLELKLHGRIQGGNVFFYQPESKLAPLYWLSLSGQVILSLDASTSSNNSHSGNKFATVTVTVTNTLTTSNNVAATQTVTQTRNNTATVTEFNNQTLTVVQTVTGTNSTIYKTVTATVSNITTTQTVTTTVANTTITHT